VTNKTSSMFLIRTVHKRRPQSRGLSSADIFRTRGRGFIRSGRPHFLAQKASDFSKLMVCLYEQRGLSHYGSHFTDWGGQIFAIMCGRLLWTAPYIGLTISWPINFKIFQNCFNLSRICLDCKLHTNAINMKGVLRWQVIFLD